MDVVWKCLAALVLSIGALGGCAGTEKPATTHSKPANTELKVMSFNIRYGTAADGENAWERRKEMVFKTVRDSDPELVGLQEALKFQVDEMRVAMPQYGVVFVGRDDGEGKGEACAILYAKARLTLNETNTFWLSDTPEVVNSNTWKAACTRICTWAHFTDVRTGKGLYFFNTHLDHISGPARVKSVRLIMDRIKARSRPEDAVVLTGDFNDGESSEPVRIARSGMVDAFRAVHPDVAPHGVGTFNGFKNKTDGDKIDYIFVSPGTKVTAAEIVRTTWDGRNASDHFAVTATVKQP